ncbi:hypothetical protein PHLGIDRAFT_119584 [Phlebiopsis gigantea 11061_1 CR5-6]|uniref:AMP-dependent synthetase/ligase domain-containing protein n=1 Tax=Phlebiopsis gigantea (strain 11061_1 CR5-6) TaxID=745531 RepID=A0A0C3S8W1_PHLG1|nr:hypothetical protein PHLGIDRAFT_119584 [Phlebiopsis gigantea 11061_1 CR5-6]
MAHFMHMVLAGLQRWPDAPLIRPFTGTDGAYAWGLVTFADFQRDLERTAAHYQAVLGRAGLHAGDVVGLWLTGEHVSDLVHLYGLARAGFVPELFSLKFSAPGGAVVRDLLAECAGRALGDVAIIFHTSGTTGGRPKPVPQSHSWCKTHSMVCWKGIWQGSWDTPDVVNNIGSFAHMGASTYIYKSAFSGGSFVQTSRPDIGAEEFLAMVRQCGLNRLLQYASWLSALISEARQNGEVLEAMQGLRQVVYTGVSMNPEDEAWALANGIPITNLYGTTETAQCMISDLGAAESALRPIPELGLQLVPALHAGDAQTQLFDLFLPLSARNCPHPSVRNRPDGHVTGDLFEEVRPGYYAFRGRSDDWIKTGPTRAAFCDTK